MKPPRRISPTEELAFRRVIRSNGKPAHLASDTIGRIWAFDLLDNCRYTGDLLRDAGQRYAGIYFHRFGTAAAKVGRYEDMISSGSIQSTMIADQEKDMRAEKMFRLRDEALRATGRRAADAAKRVLVNGHGDDDPDWLSRLIEAYQTGATKERAARDIADQNVRRAVVRPGRKDSKAKSREIQNAKRRLKYADRMVRERLAELRNLIVPAIEIADIRIALAALADVDRAEGRHAGPKSGS